MDLRKHLRTFRTHLIDRPSREETLITWEHLAEKLPLESQTRLLTVWNKRLAGVQSSQELERTIDRIICELEKS